MVFALFRACRGDARLLASFGAGRWGSFPDLGEGLTKSPSQVQARLAGKMA